MKTHMCEQLSPGKCTLCHRPGFRFRGNHWQCVVHNRFDTMRNCARAKGKLVPSVAELEAMAAVLGDNGMACAHCQVVMAWAGDRRGQPNVVSLQHDRDGGVRLICMLCNAKHRSFPGDSFYQHGHDSKFCPKCKTIKSVQDFYTMKNGLLYSYCRDCSATIAKRAWAGKKVAL